MTKKPSIPNDSILETELARVAEQQKIEGFKIVETVKGFYVLASIKERGPETLFMATRREPDKPRVFKDLERLNTMLRNIYPNGVIELECHKQYQGESTPVGKTKLVAKRKTAKKS